MQSLLNPIIEIAHRLPHDAGAPVINGASVFAMTPGKFAHYTLPVRGVRPLAFSIKGTLPEGVSFDSTTGCFSGRAATAGEYQISITVSNAEGESTRDLTLIVREGFLGAAPLMGWTSWNAYEWRIDQEKILKNAELLYSLGLSARGYSYVNIDSCWQGNRTGDGPGLHPNSRFSDMPGMVEKIHKLGLKAGIYSTPMVIAWGSTQQEIFAGSTGYPLDPESFHQYFGGCGQTSFEDDDAKLWAGWGFDYLKYDWPMCDIPHTKRMREALDKTGRDMILSLTTNCKVEDVVEYRKYAQSYRNNIDTRDRWKSIEANIYSADPWIDKTGPGGWFDLDMLAVGIMTIDRNRKDIQMPEDRNCLTKDEAITHFSVWSILGSPLQLSCQLDKIDEFTLDLVSNEEIIAVNQDITSLPELWHNEAITEDSKTIRKIRIYRKTVSDGGQVCCFVNFADEAAEVVFSPGKRVLVRDLWSRRDLGSTENVKMVLPPHGSRMLKFS
ncbi:MAG: putative Ig domain-containing protein [Lentisphaeria bacterium]|nr:putative Ig domain-containing protein [Lentisphaeria bacterium]